MVNVNNRNRTYKKKVHFHFYTLENIKKLLEKAEVVNIVRVKKFKNIFGIWRRNTNFYIRR